MARLQEKYKAELVGEIQQKLGLKNPMEVPKITKITLNMGVGEAVADKKVMEHARADMKKIAGQNPVTRLARKSVAGFKIRDGYPIGCKVTLRRERMYEFLDRLVSIAIPRIRDFRGLNPKSFDRQGNYSMGVTEQIIFPEINYDEIDTLRGMDITIKVSILPKSTSSQTRTWVSPVVSRTRRCRSISRMSSCSTRKRNRASEWVSALVMTAAKFASSGTATSSIYDRDNDR